MGSFKPQNSRGFTEKKATTIITAPHTLSPVQKQLVIIILTELRNAIIILIYPVTIIIMGHVLCNVQNSTLTIAYHIEYISELGYLVAI